jgi:hypothetical protein
MPVPDFVGVCRLVVPLGDGMMSEGYNYITSIFRKQALESPPGFKKDLYKSDGEI